MAKTRQSDAAEFDAIAEDIFAPIYPVIARRMAELTGINSGLCVDAGAGGGHLGLAMAEFFDGEVVLLDNDDVAVAIAAKRVSERNAKRVTALLGDMQSMPLTDNSVDLLISRGALWFLEPERAMREIWRVLAPGGAACVGSGYGSAELKAEIYAKMSERTGTDYGARQSNRRSPVPIQDYADVLINLGVETCRVVSDESGDWIVAHKPR
jgi:ubiquinone/menaquinone biosynthesis C-methylase UbiE